MFKKITGVYKKIMQNVFDESSKYIYSKNPVASVGFEVDYKA
jgi:hypothetical protein